MFFSWIARLCSRQRDSGDGYRQHRGVGVCGDHGSELRENSAAQLEWCGAGDLGVVNRGFAVGVLDARD